MDKIIKKAYQGGFEMKNLIFFALCEVDGIVLGNIYENAELLDNE